MFLSLTVFSHTQQQYTLADENERVVPDIALQPDADVVEPQPGIDIDDGEIVDGPTVLASVALARTPRK
jgi:hypothetical protein